MGTSRNYLRARRHAAEILQNDAEAIARLAQAMRDDPLLPNNRQQRLVDDARQSPEVMLAYFSIRQSLWEWEEFASVRFGARAILEVVIELARDEALPWYVAVPAEDVRRMARLCEKSYAECVRELETLAITRPARRVRLANANGEPRFPGIVNQRESPEPIAQWVVRYRRGIPWNKKRAAWWINYDLLCGTGRVLPGFIVNLRTLDKTYFGRNQRMGRSEMNWVNADVNSDAFRALEEMLTKNGPLPTVGFRAPVWRM